MSFLYKVSIPLMLLFNLVVFALTLLGVLVYESRLRLVFCVVKFVANNVFWWRISLCCGLPCHWF